MAELACRSCGAPLLRTLVDLGEQPLANAYLSAEQVAANAEPVFPLHARVCDECHLVQVEDAVSPETIFSDYAYFSSYSDSWLAHGRRYVKQVIDRLDLDQNSFVVEVASNDGYLLQHFIAAEIPVRGVEPAGNVAAVALEAGIPTDVRFFGQEYARELRSHRAADLLVANNVLAHVPDLDDFVRGIAVLMGPDGVATIEVPHLLQMIQGVEFDTIYHEHFSYFSLLAAVRAFEARTLRVFDVEELPTHGGSLRLWVAHADSPRPRERAVDELLAREREAGLDTPVAYADFTAQVEASLQKLRSFLDTCRDQGAHVAAYGAAAKGNTLLNACGATARDIAYVVDRNPHKQGRFMPGSHLPIYPPDHVHSDRPDYLLILPWNLRDEIIEQMAGIREWGCQFVTAIPEVEIIS